VASGKGSLGSSLICVSSTIWTLILPWLVSEHNSNASTAFSSGKVCETNGFKSSTPPLKHEMPAGQVSQYRLMNFRSIYAPVVSPLEARLGLDKLRTVNSLRPETCA
jgi:hypothetical protein